MSGSILGSRYVEVNKMQSLPVRRLWRMLCAFVGLVPSTQIRSKMAWLRILVLHSFILFKFITQAQFVFANSFLQITSRFCLASLWNNSSSPNPVYTAFMVSPTSEWTLRIELISLSCDSKSRHKNCLGYLSLRCLPWVRASKTKCMNERLFSDTFTCVIHLSIS